MELVRALQTSLQQLGRAQGKQGAAGPRPLLLQGRGTHGEGMGTELKLDSPMKLMGGQILP